jgi:hypothetical protein
MILKPKSAVLLTFALLGFLFALPSQAQSACVTFEAPDFFLGDVFGRPIGQVSGDLAFSSNGIDGYVYNFLTFLGPAFNRADVVNAPAPVAFSPGQSLRTNNINIQFDFTNLPFTARKVTFLYLDLGGNENLAPNPGGIYVGELSTAPPVLNGANVTVSAVPVPGGKRGSVVITAAAVKEVRVGGQELWIDSVCATP